jgi:hypothetical protein
MELPRGEYDLVIMMPSKKDILDNWIKHHIYGDCYQMKKKKVAFPLGFYSGGILSQLFAFWTSFPNLYPFNARSFL